MHHTLNQRLINRFMSKVVKQPGGCWRWIAGTTNSGYGKFAVTVAPGQQKHRLAHRLSYEIHLGEIPDGLTIDHLCRVKLCVNPEHLEAVTLQVNVTRAWEQDYPGHNRPTEPYPGRATHCKQGHEFTEANTLWHSRPNRATKVERTCRVCWNARSVRERAKRSAMRESDMGTRIG